MLEVAALSERMRRFFVRITPETVPPDLHDRH